MRTFLTVIMVMTIFFCVAVSCSSDDGALSPEEMELVDRQCFRCHRNADRLSRDDVHEIHANADCVTCHVGERGLESADRAHDVLEWVGIGLVALVVTGIGLNYAVTRRRISSRETGSGTKES